MALRVNEYAMGFASGRPRVEQWPVEPQIQVQISTAASGGAASTMTLSAGTRFVTLDTDAGMYVIFTSSTSAAVASSTNGIRIPAGVAPIGRWVNPSMRVVSIST